jgi:hypothetical protein
MEGRPPEVVKLFVALHAADGAGISVICSLVSLIGSFVYTGSGENNRQK